MQRAQCLPASYFAVSFSGRGERFFPHHVNRSIQRRVDAMNSIEVRSYQFD